MDELGRTIYVQVVKCLDHRDVESHVKDVNVAHEGIWGSRVNSQTILIRQFGTIEQAHVLTV
jgi:hypothetical protein